MQKTVKFYVLIEKDKGLPFYVGYTTTSLKKRLTSHLCDARRHPNRRICKKISQLKASNVKIIIKELEIFNYSDKKEVIVIVNKREPFWINYFRKKDYILYNTGKGGNVANIAEAVTSSQTKPVNVYDLEGNFINYFKSISEANRKLFTNRERTGDIVCVCKGKKFSILGYVFRYKGESFKKYKKKPNTKTSEGKKRISESQKGANNSMAVKILQYDIEGNFLKQWDCRKHAEEYYNISVLTIKDDTISAGYRWRYWVEEFPLKITFKKDTSFYAAYCDDGSLYKIFTPEELLNHSLFHLNRVQGCINHFRKKHLKYRWRFQKNNNSFPLYIEEYTHGKYKKILQMNTEKEIISSFPTIANAAKVLESITGYSFKGLKTSISQCLKKTKQTCCNYYWEYD
jgi:GIY-YIG catalytic domain/NUMOD1 domain